MITDQFQRPLQDLRISVTDRCNLRCSYCMPAEIFDEKFSFLPSNELLSFEEIQRLVENFAKLGVKKVRITGGEPLLRRDIEKLVEKIVQTPIQDVGLTTNGLLLMKKAKQLKEAGLKRVNVSLDSIDQQTLQSLNGRKINVSEVLDSIFYAKEIGLEVKINMVVIKGKNDHEILAMAEFFKNKEIPLRFIEFMDVGCTNQWKLETMMTSKEILQTIHEAYPVEPVNKAFGEVADKYRYIGTNTEIGFITSVSSSFCTSCTRGRISADGRFFLCLFANQGHDLKKIIRSGATDEEIQQSITQIWANRNDRYSELRVAGELPKQQAKIEMSFIGG